MRPSQAMGLFQSTWRSEWACLSRAQLARLVSSQLHKPNFVTVSVVRKWESGQPPKSLEELDALCLVMRVHGLAEPEVRQFRDSVPAALLDRHYEGLFPGADLAWRPDCHELAAATYWETCRTASARNIVTLLAQVTELRNLRVGASGPASHHSHEYHQDEAVIWLTLAIAGHHRARSRYALAEKWCYVAAFDVEHRLRGHLTPEVNTTRVAGDAITYGALADLSPARLGALLDLATQEDEAGHRLRAASLRGEAACFSLDLPDADLHQYWYGVVKRDVAIAEEFGGPVTVGIAHKNLHRLAVAQGAFDLAEEHLEQFRELARPWGPYAVFLPYLEGIMLRALGQLASAAARFAEGEKLARRDGWLRYVRDCRRLLAECEHAQHELRHRGKGRIISSQRAGR